MLVVATRRAVVISSRIWPLTTACVVHDRDVLDRPEGQAFFAFGARALEFLDGREQQRDGVERRRRFDILFGLKVENNLRAFIDYKNQHLVDRGCSPWIGWPCYRRGGHFVQRKPPRSHGAAVQKLDKFDYLIGDQVWLVGVDQRHSNCLNCPSNCLRRALGGISAS